MKKIKQDFPIGVSQWQNMGKKWGYDKYFEEKIRLSERRRVMEMITKMKYPVLLNTQKEGIKSLLKKEGKI